MLMHAILTMNSEAMIPSTMAQKNDAMTPILMNIIAAMSFKTGRELKTKLNFLCRFISKCVIISFGALTKFPIYCVDCYLHSSYEKLHQNVSTCVCPDWSPAVSGQQGDKRNVWLLALPVQKRFVTYGQRDNTHGLLYQQGQSNSPNLMLARTRAHTHTRAHTADRRRLQD